MCLPLYSLIFIILFYASFPASRYRIKGKQLMIVISYITARGKSFFVNSYPNTNKKKGPQPLPHD